MTSHYQCWFTGGPKVDDWIRAKGAALSDSDLLSATNAENLSLSCCDATLPGSTFQTHDVMAYAGVNEKFAYMRAYDDRSDFTFYVNEQYLQLKYFEGWSSYIADEQYIENARGGIRSKTYNYRMNFPEDYRGSIRISKFERSYGGEKTGKNQKIGRTLDYIFVDAYPLSIASIPVSYNSSELLKCTVSFTYSRYYIESKALGGITLPNASSNQGTTTTINQGFNPSNLQNDLLGQDFVRNLA